MTKHALQDEARRLRAQGKSVGEIQKILGVSKSSVSLWVRNVPLTETQKIELKGRNIKYGEDNKGAQKNKETFAQLRLEYQEAGRAKAREMRPLHLAGCMLYWAEGAKAYDRINFVNSDANMVLFFMRFLREELQVENSMISLHLHCHSSDPEEIARVEHYWTSLLGLPKSCLTKTQIHTAESPTRFKILRNGICGIRVNNTALMQHVQGAIQEYIALLLSITREHPEGSVEIKREYSDAAHNRWIEPRLRYLEYQRAGRERAKRLNPVHLAGCMLYWAEGSKHKNVLGFVNADPNMLVVYLHFLREEMQLDEKLATIYVQCHTLDKEQIEANEQYWLNLLKLPVTNLRKTRFKRGNPNTKHNIYQNGFCVINVARTELVHHIFGAIQEYANFDNPDWLF